jgi:hypothetical protein
VGVTVGIARAVLVAARWNSPGQRRWRTQLGVAVGVGALVAAGWPT